MRLPASVLHSCRNRHCPKCQALAQQKWIERQQARLVDAPHFHVVFTLPAELRPLTAFAPHVVYALLMQCAGATLLQFGQSRLHATLGAIVVLHTWDKSLGFHPHVHAIVTGGGLTPAGTWRPSRQDYLFPVLALGRVFAGKMRTELRRAYRRAVWRHFEDLQDPQVFDRLLRRVGAKNWYVYSKRSFGRAHFVLEYLGRYTHRVALSNSRLLVVGQRSVTIRTRGKGRATMAPARLPRRFVRHVLPKGFHKIRHYGLYANAPLRTLAPAPLVVSDADRIRTLTGRDIRRCPRCGCLLMSRPLPPARGPPDGSL